MLQTACIVLPLFEESSEQNPSQAELKKNRDIYILISNALLVRSCMMQTNIAIHTTYIGSFGACLLNN
jgi:hypothetical protein